MFGVKSSLLRGMYHYVSISGVGQKNKYRKLKLRCGSTFENRLQLRKAHQYVGILLGQFMLPPRLAKVKIRAVRDARRAPNDKG